MTLKRILVIALAGLASPLFALDPAIPFRQYASRDWQTEHGLPHNFIMAIAQTPDGYMWFGTREGLVRFDGVTLTTFDKTNTPAFARDHVVRSLVTDSRGRLWVATNGGVLRRDRDTFTRFDKSSGLPSDNTGAMSRGSGDTVIIGTSGGGLLEHRGGKFHAHDLTSVVTSNRVMATAQDRDGTIWFGTMGYGLGRIANGRITYLDHPLFASQVSSLFIDRRGDLWIGSDRGLARYRAGVFTDYTEKNGVRGTVIALREDSHGSLWIGTSVGLARMRDGAISAYTRADGLPDNGVSAIFEDHEQNLWIGTRAGLTQLRAAPFRVYGASDLPVTANVTSVIEARDGAIWIGSADGRVARMRGGVLTMFDTTDNGLPSAVMSIVEDRRGAIWVATAYGAYRVANERVTRFTTKDGLSTNQINRVYAATDGSIWLTSTGAKLNRFLDGKITQYGQSEGLGDTRIHAITTGRDGSVLLFNTAGVDRFDGRRFTQLISNAVLPRAAGSAMREDADGTIWLATYGRGLLRWQRGKVSVFNRANGLFDDTVTGLTDDRRGGFWMTSNKGVFRVTRQSLTDVADGRSSHVSCASYGMADGMRTNESGMGVPTVAAARDGQLWFATSRGLASVDPRDLRKDRMPPRVALAGMRLDFEKPLTTNTEVPAGTRRLELAYTAFKYDAPDRIRFRYRLEGFDRGWIDAGTQRSAQYMNVPPGRYRFHVIACNKDGVWSTNGASTELIVRPHFYETNWFRVLMGLAVIAAIAGAGHLRIRGMRRRERELMRLVEERTVMLRRTNEALEDANASLKELSLTDGLTGLANRRGFDELFARAWGRGEAFCRPVSVVLFDVDCFKNYNDEYGHPAGDACLNAVATAMRGALKRGGNLLARYGSEELALVMPETNAADALAAAERMRAAVAALKLPHRTSDAGDIVTVSAGTATVVPAGHSRSQLLAAADDALYIAKSSGRNRVIAAGTVQRFPALAA